MAKYSVIIATHGRPLLLARAIRTVKAQKFRDATVIVVSDDRSIETYNVARTLLSDDDAYIERGGAPGPARSRTFGLAVASSDYVIFLDDDDEFSDDYLAAVDCYTKSAANSVLFCDFYVSHDGEDRAVASVDPLLAGVIANRDPLDVYVKNFIPNSCVLYPIDAVRGKAFDETLVLNEDWEFLLNAIQGRSLRHVPVFGPIIHKTPRQNKWNRRGTLNDHLLLDTVMRIYKKWPVSSLPLREARQRLFASAGFTLPIEQF